jgi:molybdenum cofactor cytidylyltransferase
MATIDGEPVAVLAARALAGAGLPVLAVVREDAELAEALRAVGVEISVCPAAALGMGHSLAHGVTQLIAAHAPDAIVVALADMPSIRTGTIRDLVAAVGPDAPIVVPEFDGRRGHPVVFWRSCFEALTELSGDRGAAALLREGTVHRVPVRDPAILLDIDRPDDLRGASESR